MSERRRCDSSTPSELDLSLFSLKSVNRAPRPDPFGPDEVQSILPDEIDATFDATMTPRSDQGVSRQIVAEFGATPQCLRDVSVSLDRVVALDLSEGDREAARAQIEETLTIHLQILAEFGATPLKVPFPHPEHERQIAADQDLADRSHLAGVG